MNKNLIGNLIEFRWTVSKGRNTYGYRICSLYQNGKKVASCNGGGYDMKGTALGLWISKVFSEDEKAILTKTNAKGEKEFYGVYQTVHGTIILDGCCGFSCMHQCLRALGHDLEFLHETKNSEFYKVTEVSNG